MRRNGNAKLLSVLMSVILAVGMMPLPAFAGESAGNPTAASQNLVAQEGDGLFAEGDGLIIQNATGGELANQDNYMFAGLDKGIVAVADEVIGTVMYTNASKDKPKWTRMKGEDRYATAARLAEEAFSGGTSYVIIATGVDYPDALSASALAGTWDAPVLLTNGKKSSLNIYAKSALQDLRPGHVFIMGGTSVVSEGIEKEIKKLGIEVTRVKGKDRIGTSVATYNEVAQSGRMSSTVILATSQGYADTLSISPYSYYMRSPILLVKGDKMTTDVATAVSKASRVVIVGGTSAVSQAVENQAKNLVGSKNVIRLKGANRYETSKVIADWELSEGMNLKNVCVATGENYPDALATAPFCGSKGSIMGLVKNTKSPIINLLSENKSGIELGYFIGGTSAISDELAQAIVDATQGSWL